MKDEGDLRKLIEDALRLNQELQLQDKYKNYPPVTNSRTMLKDILERLNGKEKRTEIKKHSELNVGLLASKSLDLDVDSSLVSYGYALHLVWSKIAPVYFFMLNRKKRRAYRFFRKHGIIRKKISGYMSGIDFLKEVRITKIESPTIVYQWDIPYQKGDYFAPEFSSKPDCLGINEKKAHISNNNIPKDREHEKYKLLDLVEVLNSIAAKTVDTWSVDFQPGVPVSGGCRQYFNRNEKDKFKKQ